MIGRADIDDRVRGWGLREDVVEKDYVLGWGTLGDWRRSRIGCDVGVQGRDVLEEVLYRDISFLGGP